MVAAQRPGALAPSSWDGLRSTARKWASDCRIYLSEAYDLQYRSLHETPKQLDWFAERLEASIAGTPFVDWRSGTPAGDLTQALRWFVDEYADALPAVDSTSEARIREWSDVIESYRNDSKRLDVMTATAINIVNAEDQSTVPHWYEFAGRVQKAWTRLPPAERVGETWGVREVYEVLHPILKNKLGSTGQYKSMADFVIALKSVRTVDVYHDVTLEARIRALEVTQPVAMPVRRGANPNPTASPMPRDEVAWVVPTSFPEDLGTLAKTFGTTAVDKRDHRLALRDFEQRHQPPSASWPLPLTPGTLNLAQFDCSSCGQRWSNGHKCDPSQLVPPAEKALRFHARQEFLRRRNAAKVSPVYLANELETEAGQWGDPDEVVALESEFAVPSYRPRARNCETNFVNCRRRLQTKVWQGIAAAEALGLPVTSSARKVTVPTFMSEAVEAVDTPSPPPIFDDQPSPTETAPSPTHHDVEIIIEDTPCGDGDPIPDPAEDPDDAEAVDDEPDQPETPHQPPPMRPPSPQLTGPEMSTQASPTLQPPRRSRPRARSEPIPLPALGKLFRVTVSMGSPQSDDPRGGDWTPTIRSIADDGASRNLLDLQVYLANRRHLGDLFPSEQSFRCVNGDVVPSHGTINVDVTPPNGPTLKETLEVVDSRGAFQLLLSKGWKERNRAIHYYGWDTLLLAPTEAHPVWTSIRNETVGSSQPPPDLPVHPTLTEANERYTEWNDSSPPPAPMTSWTISDDIFLAAQAAAADAVGVTASARSNLVLIATSTIVPPDIVESWLRADQLLPSDPEDSFLAATPEMTPSSSLSPEAHEERWSRVKPLLNIGDPRNDSFLSTAQKDRVYDVCHEFADVFATHVGEVKRTPLATHHIKLKPGAVPHRVRPPPALPPPVQDFVNREIDALHKAGVIRPINSSEATWVSNISVAPKPTSSDPRTDTIAEIERLKQILTDAQATDPLSAIPPRDPTKKTVLTGVLMAAEVDASGASAEDAPRPGPAGEPTRPRVSPSADSVNRNPTKPSTPSSSPKKWRLCFASIRLNDATESASYSMASLEAEIAKLAGCTIMFKVDMQNGFFAVLIAEEDIPKTGFYVPSRGLWVWVVMPFGLKGAPGTFVEAVSRGYQDMRDEISNWFDDIASGQRGELDNAFDNLLVTFRKVLLRARLHNFSFSATKNRLFTSELTWCGKRVSVRGIETDPEKVLAIMKYPEPTCPAEVLSFIQMAGYHRDLIEGFATIAEPLMPLQRPAPLLPTDRVGNSIKPGAIQRALRRLPPGWDFRGNPEAVRAFNALKLALCSTPVLKDPVFDGRPFLVSTDGCKDGYGARLSQVFTEAGRSVEHPIAFASRRTEGREKNYDPNVIEVAGSLFGLNRFRSYTEGSPIVLRTDCTALTRILFNEKINPAHIRWRERFFAHDIVRAIHVPGRHNIVPDILSRIAHLDPRPEDLADHSLFEQEGLVDLCYADAFNPMPSCPTQKTVLNGAPMAAEVDASGASAEDAPRPGPAGELGQLTLRVPVPDTVSTTPIPLAEPYTLATDPINQAEPIASLPLTPTDADSSSPSPKTAFTEALMVAEVDASGASAEDAPRLGRAGAPEPLQNSNRVTDPVTTYFAPDLTVTSSLSERFKGDPDFETVIRFLLTFDLEHVDIDHRKTIRTLAKSLIVTDDGRLMFRMPSGDIREVVPRSEVDDLIARTHRANGHFGRDLTVITIKRRYHWLSMWSDISRVVLVCQKCQEFGPQHRTHLLRPVVAINPFDIIFCDTVHISHGVGKIDNRMAKKAATAVDCCTAFVWSIPIADETGSTGVKLLEKICELGTPKIVVVDGGSTFDCAEFRAKCLELNTLIHYTPPRTPSANGMIERVNGLILDRCRRLQPDGEIDFRRTRSGAYLKGTSTWLSRYQNDVIRAINEREATTIGCPPATLMVGRQPGPPPDFSDEDIRDLRAAPIGISDTEAALLAVLREAQVEDAVFQRRAAVEKSRLRHRPHTAANRRHFELGDIVGVADLSLDNNFSRKLEPRWLGPYRLVSRRGEEDASRSFKITPVSKAKPLDGWIHTKRMRIWRLPSPPAPIFHVTGIVPRRSPLPELASSPPDVDDYERLHNVTPTIVPTIVISPPPPDDDDLSVTAATEAAETQAVLLRRLGCRPVVGWLKDRFLRHGHLFAD